MVRSTKESWLQGPGDLREAEVDDVPVPGESVKVRGLAARYSAEVQGQLKITTEGRQEVAKIDVPSMERLQFVHGVIEPTFNEIEAAMIQEKYGPAFRKVIAKIDELSGINKEAIVEAEQRFPTGGTEAPRSDLGDGDPAGNNGSDLPVRTGA